MQGRYDKHGYNWSEWVVSLSRETLEAFYEAFMKGMVHSVLGSTISKIEVKFLMQWLLPLN